MNDDKKRQVIMWVVAGAIILAGIILLLVLVFSKGDDPYRPGQDGDRGGQEVRPTAPDVPGTPTPTGGDDDGNGKNPSDDDDDPSRRNGSPTPSGGRRGTPTPPGGGGNDGRNGTPTPPGGNDGRNGTPTPTGGGNGGRNGTPTPTGGGNDGRNGTPTPPGGGNDGRRGTPTPTGGGNDGRRGTPTPTGGGNDGRNGTPTPTGGGSDGRNGTPTPTGGGSDGRNGTPTPTPRIGGPTPTPRGGGGPTPTPRGGGDPSGPGGGNGPGTQPEYDWDPTDSNAARIAEQDDSYMRNGLNFGDERWQQYLENLFTRVSPDYSVDALTVLDSQGQEIFMQMSELFGNGEKVTRASRSPEEQALWDTIAGELHEATSRSQLEEIIIKYSIRFAKNRSYEPSWNSFNNALYDDDDARRQALLQSDCYMIIVGLQQSMPGKGMGYTWNEGLTTVLRDSGKPMAEVADTEDDIELFMKLGGFFNGAAFDTLTYPQKKLWWEIEAQVNAAQDTDRLEELIVLYRANTSVEKESFQAILDKYPDPLQRAERRKEVTESDLYKDIISKRRGMFSIMGTDFANWEDALASVLKGRVSINGNAHAGGFGDPEVNDAIDSKR